MVDDIHSASWQIFGSLYLIVLILEIYVLYKTKLVHKYKGYWIFWLSLFLSLWFIVGITFLIAAIIFSIIAKFII